MEDPVVPLERNLYGHPSAGLLWERQFEKILLKCGWDKVSNWECLLVHREKGLFLSVYTQYCHVGNTAKQCRLGLFQDSDFAGDLEDSKSTSGGTLCIFGSHTFVPIRWMCNEQTSVSHSSTESEIISLDTGLRLDGLPALELWDLIVSVLGNVSRVSDGSGQPDSDVHKRHKPHKKIDVMKDIDAVPSKVQSARQEASLNVFEDNEAVIKMIMKGGKYSKSTSGGRCFFSKCVSTPFFVRVDLGANLSG